MIYEIKDSDTKIYKKVQGKEWYIHFHEFFIIYID